MVRLLLDAGADVNKTNRNNISPLVAGLVCAADTKSCRQCVDMILVDAMNGKLGKAGGSTLNVNVYSTQGDSALLAACRLQDERIIRQLVQLGANKDHQNLNNENAEMCLRNLNREDLADILLSTEPLCDPLTAVATVAAMEGIRKRNA